MFSVLGEGLKKAFRAVSGQSRLSEQNLEAPLSEVRRSLIDADVSPKAADAFLSAVKGKVLGVEVPAHFTTEQFFVRCVQGALSELLGGENAPINLRAQPPAIVLLCGLQGSGKTTFAGKLAKYLLETSKKKSVGVVSTDTRRPAAVEQLKILTEASGAKFLSFDLSLGAPAIAKMARAEAEKQFLDILIVDTAGRASTAEDSALMAELLEVQKALSAVERYLVVDAMLGQDAFSVAEGFEKALGLTGIVLTKVDSDARGGAALSAFHATGKPIKFLSTGEKIDKIEAFHPDRIVSRILGMGDILSLAEEAERKLDSRKQHELLKKATSKEGLSLADFRSQLSELEKMGGMAEIFAKLPLPAHVKSMAQSDQMTKMLKRYAAIVDSMTPLERVAPKILDMSRKQRIAKGSGTQVFEVNQLIKQFSSVGKMLKQFGGLGKMGRMAQAFGIGKPPSGPSEG